MRLTGSSFAERAQSGNGTERPAQADFEGIMTAALDLLEGRTELDGIEPDALRDRLLAGYRHILVDEYQDIDASQYRLIAAIAGRSVAQDEGRPTLLAVGDDDQSIYGFRGASVEFIRRFRDDYQAELHYLVENYRSSAHICAAANALIAHNLVRMKGDRPIGVDRRRRSDPPGGRWEGLDPHGRGRVEVLELPDAPRQAAALVERIHRLKGLGGGDWSDLAMLAFRRDTLEPIRALCEWAGVPVAWPGELPPLHRVREIADFLDGLAALGHTRLGPDALAARLPQGQGPWPRLLVELLGDWREEAGEGPAAASLCLEFLYESLGEQRREGGLGQGVLLGTLHGAKGLEFPHVLIADGPGPRQDPRQDPRQEPRPGEDPEESRRLYYVGMTRAKETLTLGSLPGGGNPSPGLIEGDWSIRTRVQIEPPPPEILGRRFAALGPSDIDLGYAGRLGPGHPSHARLARLATGDRLQCRAQDGALVLCDGDGAQVARLSKAAAGQWLPRVERIESARILAMLRRRRTDGDPAYRDAYRCETWEYPLVELVWDAR
jgi:ATP-dependent DNA helicase RecQ